MFVFRGFCIFLEVLCVCFYGFLYVFRGFVCLFLGVLCVCF